MGRHAKVIFSDLGVDRRETGYYSTPDFVADFICKTLLSLSESGNKVFDPCIGEGELTLPFYNKGKHVTGFDILDMEPKGVHSFTQTDFLQHYMETKKNGLFTPPKLEADFIIANPPYNCHETEYIRTHKKELVRYLGKSTCLNMYSMFIKALIELAPENCLIGVITLDSFLTAKGHSELRELIYNECTIHNIHLCPTDLFRSQGADVRTCILILKKGKDLSGSSIFVSNRPNNTDEFKNILYKSDFVIKKPHEVSLCESEDLKEIVIDVPNQVINLFKNQRLGELFPCITGISTGNDKKYINKKQTEEFSVPFYKNPGSRRFYTQADGFLPRNFLDIDKEIPNFMVRNKKYLFKGGISCSSMGVSFNAAYLPDNVTVGVNANIIIGESERWWLMAYLNSSLCSYIVRGVLIRSNMITSGYVARIPVPELPNIIKQKLGEISNDAYNKKLSSNESKVYIKNIDRVLFDALNFSNETVYTINDFVSNIVQRS